MSWRSQKHFIFSDLSQIVALAIKQGFASRVTASLTLSFIRAQLTGCVFVPVGFLAEAGAALPAVRLLAEATAPLQKKINPPFTIGVRANILM